MGARRLIVRALLFYWRTNVAVVFGVATAVAVLAGALLVGDSVRASLRDLVLERLGRTDDVVVSSTFFREALAGDLRADAQFGSAFDLVAPLIVAQGSVSEQGGARHVSRVVVYGVDDRFWQFHGAAVPGWSEGADRRETFVSEALAADLGVTAGSAVVLRMDKPSAIPIESLHGRKDDAGRAMRLVVRAVLGSNQLGEFSLRPQQGRVRAVFVPLERIQRELELAGRVNTLLISALVNPPANAVANPPANPTQTLVVSGSSRTVAILEDIVRRQATLADLGATVRAIDSVKAVAVESAAGLLDPALAAAAERTATESALEPHGVFTYLANTIRRDDREVPYSLVTAMDLSLVAPGLAPGTSTNPPIVLNEWAARDLQARVGDSITLDYYVWEEPGELQTRSTMFSVAGVVPIAGAAADRDLAPVYPGISGSATLADWDPPFPVNLRRVRRVDEDYWRDYRTTPKAFVPFEVGQRLWRSRYGDRTSVRVTLPASQTASLADVRSRYADRLRSQVDPLKAIAVQDVRAEGLAASRGATDFGEYFTYFSFFLVVSALLLAALFFRLGIEQRAREVGLLRAVGYNTRRIRMLFAGEALALSAIGSLFGIVGAIVYGRVMMAGLGSWWRGAVGTEALRLHVTVTSLASGSLGVIAAAMICIWWTLRDLSRVSERGLLAGQLVSDQPRSPTRRRWTLVAALVLGGVGVVLIAASFATRMDKTGAFFGAGGSLLIAALCLVAFSLGRPARRRALSGRGSWTMIGIALRNAADRPGRSVFAIGIIAAATFILIAVGAFRHEGLPATDRRSGVGGYSLLVELLVPMVHDPNSREGRDALGLSSSSARLEAVRLLPGDDASCLNLYEPKNPRILGVGPTFVESTRFTFQSSLASSAAERDNPWRLLNGGATDPQTPVVPVIADANSMTYVLHKNLGDTIVIEHGGRMIGLRLVAALSDSLFQSELIMSDANFRVLFPDQGGYRILLVESASESAPSLARTIEAGARDLGADVVSTTDRLTEFHRVENTYISTFQALGGLGLLVGTIGLGAVLMRNVLERRRDLALLGAVGYRQHHAFTIVLAEHVFLLVGGLAIGTSCAVIAIAPAIAERGRALPITSGGWIMLSGVFLAGVVSSVAATGVALRTPLLAALRAE